MVWDNCSKLSSKAILEIKVSSLALLWKHLLFDWKLAQRLFIEKLAQRLFWKSRFPFFFKCENNLVFGNTLSRYTLLKKWTSSFTLYSTQNSSLKNKVKTFVKDFWKTLWTSLDLALNFPWIWIYGFKVMIHVSGWFPDV